MLRKVPDQTVPRSPMRPVARPSARARIRCARRVISAAARRVKGSSKMRRGSAPFRIKCANRRPSFWWPMLQLACQLAELTRVERQQTNCARATTPVPSSPNGRELASTIRAEEGWSRDRPSLLITADIRLIRRCSRMRQTYAGWAKCRRSSQIT